MSPEQEDRLCEALVNLGWLTTEQGLHAEGVRTIQEILHCSLDDARAALRDLRERKCIEETTSPDDRPPATYARLRWVRPPAHA